MGRSRFSVALATLAVLLAGMTAVAQSGTRIPLKQPPTRIPLNRERAPASSGQPRFCPYTGDHQDTVPLTRLAIGRAAWGGSHFLEGPRLEAVVDSRDLWARLWPVVADTVALPAVDFDRWAVIVVSSAVMGSSPSVLAIERVIRCRNTEHLTVVIRMHNSPIRLDAGERSIRAVLVPRRSIAVHEIHFVELPPVSDFSAGSTTP